MGNLDLLSLGLGSSGSLHNLALDVFLALFASETVGSRVLGLVRLDERSGPNVHRRVSSLCLFMRRVLANCSVDGLVNGLQRLAACGLVPEGELLLVGLFALALQHLHVLLDVHAEDTLSVHFRVILGLPTLHLGPWESLGGVRDVQSSVTSSLQSSEHTVASGGVYQAYVQGSLEGPAVQAFAFALALLHVLVDVEGCTSGIGDSFVHVIKSLLLEQTPGEEEACAVAS